MFDGAVNPVLAGNIIDVYLGNNENGRACLTTAPADAVVTLWAILPSSDSKSEIAPHLLGSKAPISYCKHV